MQRQGGWFRQPCWDLSLVAFSWVPVYVWIALGPLGRTRTGPEWNQAFGTALFIVLALTFIHRHYVFLIVYGDPETFAERKRGFLIAPVVLLAAVGTVMWLNVQGLMLALFVAVSLWNIWHTIMQRYGILRLYAAKARGGLEERAHGRRDKMLLWSAVVLMICLLLVFRPSTLGNHPATVTVLRWFQPLLDSVWCWVAFSAVAIATIAISLNWIRHEIRAELGIRAYLPRWSFLASTLTLLAIFLINGPVVGYLTFGAAHALEYIAFVHHFGGRRYGSSPNRPGLASWIFRQPPWTAPLLIGSFLAVYVLSKNYQAAWAWALYYTSASCLHFLFDGWIWKVRQPRVAQSLGVPMIQPNPVAQ